MYLQMYIPPPDKLAHWQNFYSNRYLNAPAS